MKNNKNASAIPVDHIYCKVMLFKVYICPGTFSRSSLEFGATRSHLKFGISYVRIECRTYANLGTW